jgi:hypothetical protein
MADLKPAWEFKTDDNVWAACLSKDGQLLIIGSWDSTAYALDRTGETVWQHKTSDYVKGIGISDDAELTVIGSYDRYIYALKRSGKLAWRYKTENYVRAVAVSGDSEFVAAGSWRGTLYYLDKRGKLLWKERVGSAIIDMAMSGDGGVAVAGCEDGSIHAYDGSGREIWTYKCGGSVMNISISNDGMRTVASAKDTMLISLNNMGELDWKFHLGGISKGLSMIQHDEITVAFTDNNFLQYVDSKGELLFMRRLPEEIWAGAVADDGVTVAVATKDNRSQFFENQELAQVVLESSQQALEKVITDNVDISKAQDMHRKAGDLLTEGRFGEAISMALEAQVLAKDIHVSQLGDRARSLIDEVDTLIADNSNMDMRKAIRLLEKARRGLQEEKLDRVLFYGNEAKAAAEESVEKGRPAVDDELFTAELKEPVDTDESDVDRLLSGDTGESPEGSEDETDITDGSAMIAEELAEEIGDMVAEPIGTETPPEPETPEGSEDDEETEPEEEEPPEEESSEVEPSEEGSDVTDAEFLDELGVEAEPSEEEDEDEDEVCPDCGEIAGTINGKCKSCYSDNLMTYAVDKAKEAHKSGNDISGLAPDLKAVKGARQARDHDEVIELSNRILLQLGDIMGEDLTDGLDAHLNSKKKRKKKRSK